MNVAPSVSSCFGAVRWWCIFHKSDGDFPLFVYNNNNIIIILFGSFAKMSEDFSQFYSSLLVSFVFARISLGFHVILSIHSFYPFKWDVKYMYVCLYKHTSPLIENQLKTIPFHFAESEIFGMAVTTILRGKKVGEWPEVKWWKIREEKHKGSN